MFCQKEQPACGTTTKLPRYYRVAQRYFVLTNIPRSACAYRRRRVTPRVTRSRRMLPSLRSICKAKQAALDPWLQRTAAVGLALSLLVTFLGAANVPIIVTLWVLYHTLVNVGQHW